MDHPNFIEVTFDKSHIITIGERLYSESIELIRELVNNAYDADATRIAQCGDIYDVHRPFTYAGDCPGEGCAQPKARLRAPKPPPQGCVFGD